MSKKTEWDWENHMTDSERTQMLALFREGDSLHERLEAIRAEEDVLRQKAIERARAAGDRKKPFVI